MLNFSSSFLILLYPSFFCIFIWFSHLLIKKIRKYIELRNSYKKIKGPESHWIWGHLKIYTQDEKGLLEHAKRMYLFPKMQSMWLAFIGTISVYFPTICGPILESDATKDWIMRKTLLPWLGDGLLLSSGNKWKRNRRLLTPAFHFDVLKTYLPVFNETVSEMISKWKNNPEVEAFHCVGLMTLDSMLQCTMSFKSGCQKAGQSNSYIKAIYDLSTILVERFVYPIYLSDFIFSFTKLGKRYSKAIKVAHNHSDEIIKERRKKIKCFDGKNIRTKNIDFLDILLLAKDENGTGLTDNEIRAEVDTFLFEGHDTTSCGISWALYNLAIYQEEQDRCRKEILNVLSGHEVHYEDLSKFSYLTMFIKESMRLYPPVPLIARELKSNIQFNEEDFKNNLPGAQSHKLLSGSLIHVSILNSHRNPHVWKNPEQFDASRFNAENSAKRPVYSYLPFAAGTRNCIGQNFAMMEMKVALALIIKAFKISLDENYTKPEMVLQATLKSANGIHLKLIPL